MSNRLYLGYLDKTMNNFETMKQIQLNRFILKKKQLPSGPLADLVRWLQ